MNINCDIKENNIKLSDDNSKFWQIGKERYFIDSYSKSLRIIIKNILKHKLVNKVYVPSYCCESMVKPFEEFGIEVEYYDVYFNYELKYNIEIDNDCEIFLAMNYFGYSSTNMEKYIKDFKNQGKIVIEDITQSILTEKRFSEYSDYLIGSLRKFFPISKGGILVNMKEKFLEEVNLDDLLEEDLVNILMKINLDEIILKRRNNSKIIYEKISKVADINLMNPYLSNRDCLLYVPIIVKSSIRDELIDYLKNKNIDLPIQWKLDEKINNIMDREISLVCDQRYDSNQIEEYIDEVIKFFC